MIKLNKRKKEILGLVIMVFSILTIISLIGHDPTINPHGVSLEDQAENTLGRFGVWLSYYHFITLGYLSILCPIILAMLGYILLTNKDFKIFLKPIIHIIIVLLYTSILMGFAGDVTSNDLFDKYLTGIIGQSLYVFINHHLGLFGTSVFLYSLLSELSQTSINSPMSSSDR